MVSIAMAALGCRDLTDVNGARMGDFHVRSSRGALTADEIYRGRFGSTDADLVPLQTWFRTSLGGSYARREGLEPEALGFLTDLIPGTSTLRGRAVALGTAFDAMLAANLGSEYERLCTDLPEIFPAVGSAQSPCNPFVLHNADPWIDNVVFRPRFSEIEVTWDAPDRELNPDLNVYFLNPTREIGGQAPGTCGANRQCPFGFTCSDPTDSTGGAACTWTNVPCSRHLDCSDVLGVPPEVRDRYLREGTPGINDTQSAVCSIGAATTTCTTSSECPTGQTCACPRGEPCAQTQCLGTCLQRIVTDLDEDAGATEPVVRIRVPVDVQTDSEEAVEFFLANIDVHFVDMEIRMQPVIDAGYPEESVLAAGYRGPSPVGDIYLEDSDLRVRFRGTTRGESIEIQPGVLLVILCALNPTDLACVTLSQGFRGLIRRALQRLVRGMALALDTIASGPRLLGPRVGDVLRSRGVTLSDLEAQVICGQLAGGSCPFTPATARLYVNDAQVDLGAARARLASDRSIVTLGAPGGAWSPSTTLAISSGADLTAVGLSFSSLPAICGEDYTRSCTGPSPLGRCAVCNECRALPGTPRACSFAPASIQLSTIRSLVDPFVCPRVRGACRDGLDNDMDGKTDLADSDCSRPSDNTECTPLSTQLSLSIPPSPTIARLIDVMPNLVEETRRVFSEPLDSLRAQRGGVARFTSARFACEDCSEQGSAVEFSFAAQGDRDGDSVFDDEDLCPDDIDPSQGDVDGDGVGDACDDCPCVVSADRGDFDGDGLQNPCDPDADGDGCNNAPLGEIAALPGCSPPLWPLNGEPLAPGALLADQVPLGCATPTLTRTCANTDATLAGGDGWIDDCDADDDADGVRDDGAANGYDHYTPCISFANVGCDDNCRLDPNPTQTDIDQDGSGNDCDLLDDRSVPPARFDDDGIWGSGFEPGFGLECIRDGRGCFAWAMFGCAGSCTSGLQYVETFARRGDSLARVDAVSVAVPAFNGAHATLPDLDGDGLDELVLGAPSASPGRRGGRLARAGEIVAVGSRTGEVLWRLSGGQGEQGFGTALLRMGDLLLVGAPGAVTLAGARTGAVYRVMLDSSPPRVDSAFFGEASGDAFGSAVAPIADPREPGIVLGLLVGAPGADPIGRHDAGRLYVTSLSGTRWLAFEGPVAEGRMGEQVATLLPNAFKQVDGVLAGIPRANGGRGLIVFFDWAGAERWRIEGSPGEELGARLTWAADWDGDGFEEIAVGAPGYASGAGRVYVATGRGLTQEIIEGRPGERLGAGLAAMGDLDRDAVDDLVVALPGLDTATDGRRGTWMLLSGAGGKNPNLPISIEGP